MTTQEATMAHQDEDPRSAMALRIRNDLRGNYFADLLDKWLTIAQFGVGITTNKEIIPPSQEAQLYRLAQMLVRNVYGDMSAPQEMGQFANSGDPTAIFRFSADVGRRFEEVAVNVRKDVNEYIDTFIPEDLQDRLRPLPTPTEPLQLLCTVAASDIATRLQFEALRDLELAIDFSFQSAQHRWNKLGDADSEQLYIERLLHQFGFPAGRLEKKKMLIDLYDRSRKWQCRKYRIVDCEQAKKIAQRKSRATKKKRHCFANDFFYINIQHYRNRIGAIIQARRKRPLRGFARRFRDQPSCLMAPSKDANGIRLAYVDTEAMTNGITTFQLHTIVSNGATRQITRANVHADPSLSIVSQQIILGDNLEVELQHVLIADLINILYSTSHSNHTLYHFRWDCTPGHLLDQLWPYGIYRVDWQNKDVQNRCIAHIIERINKRRQKDRLLG